MSINKNILTVFLSVMVLLTIALSFRGINIGRELSQDEMMLFKISGQDFNKVIPLLRNIDMHPPLTYLLIHFLMKLSDSATLIRLYFVVFGLGCCLLTYLLARELFNREVALLALLFSAFSPLLIFVSQYVRSYIDSAFWMLMSSLFMLRLIKGRYNLLNWIGYIISSTLSIYTFYFSFILAGAQFIFINVFIRNNRRLTLKWYAAFLVIAVAFLPWLPSMLHQFKGATSLSYDWSDKGFKFAGLRLGLYLRNIFSIAGFDPAFMTFRGGVSGNFTKPLLAVVSILSFAGVIWFLHRCLVLLKERFSGHKEFVCFLPFFVFVPLLLSWIGAVLCGFLPNAKYFAAFHAMFLILIAFFIYAYWKKRRLISVSFALLIIAVFSIRIPLSVSAEIELEKASRFLSARLGSSDALVCVRVCPKPEVNRNIIDAMDYLKFNEKMSEYEFSSSADKDKLAQGLTGYKNIWFCRAAGNIEVFGANQLLDNLLVTEGYAPNRIKEFKNIDIIKYEKLTR